MSVRFGRQSKHRNAEFRDRVLLLLAFSCTYLVWGSTYLAIRYAVETIPPLFVASLRHLIGGEQVLQNGRRGKRILECIVWSGVGDVVAQTFVPSSADLQVCTSGPG